jgi:hypothetical protein
VLYANIRISLCVIKSPRGLRQRPEARFLSERLFERVVVSEKRVHFPATRMSCDFCGTHAKKEFLHATQTWRAVAGKGCHVGNCAQD